MFVTSAETTILGWYKSGQRSANTVGPSEPVPGQRACVGPAGKLLCLFRFRHSISQQRRKSHRIRAQQL